MLCLEDILSGSGHSPRDLAGLTQKTPPKGFHAAPVIISDESGQETNCRSVKKRPRSSTYHFLYCDTHDRRSASLSNHSQSKRIILYILFTSNVTQYYHNCRSKETTL